MVNILYRRMVALSPPIQASIVTWLRSVSNFRTRFKPRFVARILGASYLNLIKLNFRPKGFHFYCDGRWQGILKVIVAGSNPCPSYRYDRGQISGRLSPRPARHTPWRLVHSAARPVRCRRPPVAGLSRGDRRFHLST